MATINNEYLQDTFNSLATIEIILQREVEQIKRNKDYIDKIVPEQLGKTHSKKMDAALKFADKLTRTAYENSVVSLVATFEKVVLLKYKTSYGELKKVVSTNANRSLDYYKSRENFIKDIDGLSEIIRLIEGHITVELLQKLKQIKAHRNYIAHGKNGVPPDVELQLSEIVTVLDEVIREIES